MTIHLEAYEIVLLTMLFAAATVMRPACEFYFHWRDERRRRKFKQENKP